MDDIARRAPIARDLTSSIPFEWFVCTGAILAAAALRLAGIMP